MHRISSMLRHRCRAPVFTRGFKPSVLHSAAAIAVELPQAVKKTSPDSALGWLRPEGGTIIDSEFEDVGDEERRAELLIRMSTLLEDDPNMALEFAQALQISPNVLVDLDLACQLGETREATVPTSQQLRQVCLASALPFLGFGILDNGIMIVFGDVIDASLCTTLGFSTMTAAALGNTLSDGFGVYSGGAVEDLAEKAGYSAPPLSRAQQAMDETKSWERFGQLFGITVGCLIGMFPLLLINSNENEVKKREKMLESMYDHVVVAVEDLLDCEAAMLVFVDDEKKELYSRAAAHHGNHEFNFKMCFGEGVMGSVAATGKFLNIADLRAESSSEFYVPELHDDFRGTGIKVQSMLCMPVFGPNLVTGVFDKVVALVGVVNKKNGRPFSDREEDALAALCSHISTSLSFIHGEEHGFDETLNRCSQVLKMRGTRINSAQAQRVHDLYSQLLQKVCESTNSDFAQLLSIDVHYGQVRCLATSADLGARQITTEDNARRLEDSGIIREVVSKKHSITTDDGMYTSSFLKPLCDSQGEVIGVVRVVGNTGRTLDGEGLRLLEEVANTISSTMCGATDSLSHLLNVLREN